MHFDNLETDKSYFIMQDGEVFTYYKTTVTEQDGVQLLVYDRTSPRGLTPLNTQDVKYILNENSKHYNDTLKFFLKFLSNDLKNRPTLHAYIIHIWNGDSNKASELYDEDCTLPEQFGAYMEELINREAFDEASVRYFNAVYFEQEVIYPKYSEDWLINNTAC